MSCHLQSCCSNSNCGCSCQTQTCGCSCHQQKGVCGAQSSEEMHGKHFLDLADQAWWEVLKEKIKDHIRSNNKHLDDLARLISEANHERWQKKMDAKKCCGSFEEKLSQFFGQSCSEGCSTKK